MRAESRSGSSSWTATLWVKIKRTHAKGNVLARRSTRSHDCAESDESTCRETHFLQRWSNTHVRPRASKTAGKKKTTSNTVQGHMNHQLCFILLTQMDVLLPQSKNCADNSKRILHSCFILWRRWLKAKGVPADMFLLFTSIVSYIKAFSFFDTLGLSLLIWRWSLLNQESSQQ